MAFNDTYRESIQTKHVANVGFTSTAKGVTNEAFALKNPHQVIASQIPAVDVVGTYGPLVANGIGAGLVEEHTVKLTADPTVNDNKAWIATEDNCETAGHAARGSVRLEQWMRYAETQYKLRLFEDDGTGTAPNMSAEILPSEPSFNWEYDASAGIIYFDDNPATNGKTTPLWGVFYTYVGNTVEDGLGATTSGVQDLVELFDDTNEPTGFVDRTSSTLSFDNGTRTLTISGTSFSYYIEGEKYTKTGAESIQIGSTEGMHYVYYSDGTLTTSNSWSYNLIYTEAYVSAIYWDATNSKAIYVADERHGITMDGQTHAYLHSSLGTQYVSGLSLANVVVDQDGTNNAHAQFGTTAGVIRDEDIAISIPADATPAVMPVYYRDGALGNWRWDTPTNYPVKSYSGGSNRVAWNQYTGGAWQQSESPDGSFVLTHIFATNDINYPWVAVQGQASYGTLGDAQLGATEELNSLVLSGLPFEEFSAIATVIYQTADTYTNAVHARVVSTEDSEDYVDWRFSGLSPLQSSVIDHANLDGLNGVNVHPAGSIFTSVTNFDGALSSADTTVQAALDTLDDAVQTNTDNLATASGTLQSQISQNASDISDNDTDIFNLQTNLSNLDSELTTVSGYLQGQITQNANDISTNGGLISDLDAELTTASGYLQGQIDSNDSDITDLYSTIATTSGSLQSTMDSNYLALDTKIDTTSGTLQSEIDALDTSLTDAIVWETVDTPFEQIRPKVAHQGKAIYTYGALTIGGDLTVSGTTTTVHSEELTVADKVITVNAGEAGAGITGERYAGIEVDRGTEENYYFVYDEVENNFRVGISGSLQAVATREDTPTDQYVAFWNESEYRFDTAGGIAVSDIASTAALASVSGTLQSAIDSVATDLANNYYTSSETDSAISSALSIYYTASETDSAISTALTSYYTSAQLDAGQLDNRYYTETEVDGLISSISGVVANDFYTKVQLDGGQLDNRYYTETEIDNTFTSYYTSAQVDSLLGGQNEFLELTDVLIPSFTEGNVLFTTSSGVFEDEDFYFDLAELRLHSNSYGFGTAGYFDELVTTVTSGTTHNQLASAKAIWDLTEAAAAAVHTHYDVDATYVSDTSWTYGTGFAAVPDDLMIFVNGVKQRIGASYDCTVAVPGGVVTVTFNYNVYSSDWVNINYTA